jgi:predicted O-methyltransferase YrrM
MRSPGIFVQFDSCETSYPLELIRRIMEVKGLAYLCDEILRDEHPQYVEQHLRTTLLAHVAPRAFSGKRIMDFGSGGGASTMILARLFPDAEIVGVDLEVNLLSIARLRAEHYGFRNVRFLQSRSGSELPEDVGDFDFIVLCAVYEHLLPDERRQLLPQLWTRLKYGGVFFIDETPNRCFPVETHTTCLPFINYLPDPIALAFARRFSRRTLAKDSWSTLLRKGIRGATVGEVLRILAKADEAPVQLESIQPGIGNVIDLWFEGYARHAPGLYGNIKRALGNVLKGIRFLTGITLVPYLSLAIQRRNVRKNLGRKGFNANGV